MSNGETAIPDDAIDTAVRYDFEHTAYLGAKVYGDYAEWKAANPEAFERRREAMRLLVAAALPALRRHIADDIAAHWRKIRDEKNISADAYHSGYLDALDAVEQRVRHGNRVVRGVSSDERS